MRRKRVYIQLPYPEYLQLNFMGAVEARCASNMAKKIVQDRLRAYQALDPEMRNRVEGWEREENERCS